MWLASSGYPSSVVSPESCSPESLPEDESPDLSSSSWSDSCPESSPGSSDSWSRLLASEERLVRKIRVSGERIYSYLPSGDLVEGIASEATESVLMAQAPRIRFSGKGAERSL